MRQSFLPQRIARNISQRSKASNGSVDLRADEEFGEKIEPLKLGSGLGGINDGYRGAGPLSPLPPVAKSNVGMGEWRPNQSRDGGTGR
jgi:hypothetical protein